MIGVPLMREGGPIGVIGLARTRVEPFKQREIELVTTFADQAVIAIENARLFEAEQQRARELTESLEQQTATSEVLQVISRSSFDLPKVLNTLLESAARLCEADKGAILRPTKSVQIPDVLADPEYTLREIARLGDFRTVLGVPLLREGFPIGLFVLHRAAVRPFTEKQIKLVETFADQAVIAIENARLFEAEQQRTRELTELLKYQTATSDVLKVISRSTFDLQPILDALVETAARLCQSDTGLIASRDGDIYRGVATFAYSPDYAEFWRNLRLRPTRATITGRAALERRTIHITDVTADPEYKFPESVKLGRNRTLLGVPLLRDGEPIGVISFGRERVEPFTERQIELVRTFADQAVIAIENTRLLNELRQRTTDLTERTADLSEALEQQTATSEVLALRSRSSGDLEPVFSSVLENATKLCEAKFANLYLCEGSGFRTGAMHNAPVAFAEARRREPIVYPGPESELSRARAAKRPVQIADISANRAAIELDSVRALAVNVARARTVLSVPKPSRRRQCGEASEGNIRCE